MKEHRYTLMFLEKHIDGFGEQIEDPITVQISMSEKERDAIGDDRTCRTYARERLIQQLKIQDNNKELWQK